MMGEAKHEVRAVFVAAVALNTPEERARYLDEACQGKPELRERVEALLRAHEEAGGFLEANGLEPDCVPEGPGTVISHYRLLEQIGEGGFGVVFMAEQLEPIHRRVALKIVKPGMDTKEVIARFEAERQALAMMDHPNIAKVFDAGTTGAAESQIANLKSQIPSGRPFFVMELVKGIPIADYCDQEQLSPTDRLRLFMQVCQGVQHAHQKGIIHRDLKPTNILVTLIDGKAVPKIIDFGVAKALGQKLTEKTLFTAFEQILGTPAYMSPEQAALSGVDVDTRSDIYSLGVLLYELLTGVTPFDAETFRKAALDEIRRMIRETEPPKPSTRVRGLGEKLTEVAQHRQTEPSALPRLMQGDLDWIVMKALEKERARRYETAGDLAEDIQRHLDHHPVLASPPGAAYRTRKFVRRHRVGVALTATAVTALLVGLSAALVGFMQARQERDRALAAEAQAEENRQRAEAQRQKAQTEAARSAQVAQFMQDLLKGVGPSVALGRDTTMLREILGKTVERVGKDLKDQPEVEAELRDTLGWVYYDLGEDRTAEKFHREALTLRRKLYGGEHRKVADSLLGLGYALYRQLKLAEAETVQREALAIRRKLFGNDNLDTAQSLDGLAVVVSAQGKPTEAEAILREALSIQKQFLREPNSDIAWSLLLLSATLNNQGKPDEAETIQREALAMERALYGNKYPTVALSLSQLGMVLARGKKYSEAEACLTQSLAALRELQASNYLTLRVIRFSLARVLACEGKQAESEPLYREELERLHKEAQQGNVASQNEFARQLATCLLPALRNGAAAVSFAEKAVAATNRKNADYLDTLAAAYAEVGDFPQAIGVQQEAIGLLGPHEDKQGYESRLRLYQSGSPVRE